MKSDRPNASLMAVLEAFTWVGRTRNESKGEVDHLGHTFVQSIILNVSMSNEKVGIAKWIQMANKPSKPKLIQIKWPTPPVFCKNLLHVWGNHRGFPPEVRLSYEGFHVPCAWRCGLRGSASWQCRTWTTCNCSLDRIVNARTDAAEYCKSSARFVSFHLYASLSPLCDFRWFYWVHKTWSWKWCNPCCSSCTSPIHSCPIDLTKEGSTGSTPTSAGRMPHVFSECGPTSSQVHEVKMFHSECIHIWHVQGILKVLPMKGYYLKWWKLTGQQFNCGDQRSCSLRQHIAHTSVMKGGRRAGPNFINTSLHNKLSCHALKPYHST